MKEEIKEIEKEKIQFLSTIMDPIDFSLTSKIISPINCPNIVNDFQFIVGGTSYDTNKNLVRSVFHSVDIEINKNQNITRFVIDLPDPNYDFQSIQSLLAGNTITINEKNANFLFNIGSLLGCQELVQVTLPFQKRYQNNQLIPPTPWEKACTVFFSFFSSFTIAMRIILFLCELIGYAVAFGFCFNFAMIPITAGIISPTIPTFYRWALMLPFLFFQINVINLLSLITYYLCEFNFFRSKTFLPKHLHRPFCKKEEIQDFSNLNINLSQSLVSSSEIDLSQNFDNSLSEQSISSKSQNKIQNFFNKKSDIYDLILGITFFLVLGSFLFDKVFKYIMLAITIYIPVILIVGLVFLYGFHAFLSNFPSAREKYIKYDDLSDPFLSSMYFEENPWVTFFIGIYQKFIHKRDGIVTPNGEQSILKLFLTAFFTIGLYISFMIIILLITERNSFTPSQSISIIFILIILLIPLLCAIKFHYFLIGRLFSVPKSEQQLSDMRGWIHSPKQREQWLSATLTWSKSTVSIRLTRLCFLIFFFFLLFLSVFFIFQSRQDSSTSLNSSNSSSNSYLHLNSDKTNNETNNNRTITISNPICSLNMANLSILQYAALAQAVYISNASSSDYMDLVSEYFSNEEALKIEENIITNPYSGFLRRFSITKRDGRILNIISIRGTSNMYDMMADVELWAASFVMNLLQVTIPIMSAYSTDSRFFLGYTMHLPRFLFTNYSLINNYIKVINDNSIKGNGTETVIVGHSLGGGLAKLASAMTGYQAIAFSGPGIQALSAFYEFKDNNLVDTFVNIVPLLDPVAAVDHASGSDFLIPCEKGIISCHSIKRTLCMLGILCGEYEKHFQYCSSYFGFGLT